MDEGFGVRLDEGPSSAYRAGVVRVAQRGRFSVYVYDEQGERHHLAHCHVRWREGRVAVSLPDLVVLTGPPLPTEALDLLREHRVELRAAWNRLNPRRPIE